MIRKCILICMIICVASCGSSRSTSNSNQDINAGIINSKAVFDTEGMDVSVPIDVDWQLPVIRKVKFDATIISINDIVKVADTNRWIGFIVFKCEAKENLGSRLMWANIDVTFTNNATRSFRASFYINVKGCQYDVKKINFESTDSLKIKEIVVKSVAIK